MRFVTISTLCALVIASYAQAESTEADPSLPQLLHEVNTLYLELGKKLEKLKSMTGGMQELDSLQPLLISDGDNSKVIEKTKEGAEAFTAQDFEAAKEKFYAAWEQNPTDWKTNYNLGLSYYHLGNQTLAKKMFLSVVDEKVEFPHKDILSRYINPVVPPPPSTPSQVPPPTTPASEVSTVDKELLEIKNLMINKRNQVDTLMRSTSLSYPEKMESTVKVLDDMWDLGKKNKEIAQEYFLIVAQSYSVFELYARAEAVLKDYAAAMEGKVLPEEYHAFSLKTEESTKKQKKQLESYLGFTPPQDVQAKLGRDLRELKVFATQLDHFVPSTSSDDRDFQNFCKRLKEYRWANKEGKHVIVVNEYGQILYSSLEGTVAIDRYQDIKGKQFLKDITYLSPFLKLEQVETVPVDLSVSGKAVPYYVTYTYVPKHKAFIIVRLPREDLL